MTDLQSLSPVPLERWRVLSPYLDQALELTADELDGWLERIRLQDAVMAGELETLLGDREALRHATLLTRNARPTEHALHALHADMRIGSYTLVSPLGRGGMGVVWLAERNDGRFVGRAAIKLLHASCLGHGSEERFTREGHVLARLTHDNVARLLDAGVTDAGQPFLVLEYVEGDHIDRYCDAHALDVDARLRLFLSVLDAVAHAHANLIVHRDLKPSNVLVRSDGTVKLLDFGIAKLLEDERSPDTPPLTVEGALLMTPEYAAPEQVTGAPVTTATDVYALGMLLYVLLGAPHPVASQRHSIAGLLAAIVESVPPRPSAVSPLGRSMRPDLDAIVERALKKAPHERYGSVAAFADDLRRYLRREPVSARPDSRVYRAGMFLRRHARSVAALTIAAVTLAGLVGLHTYRLAVERDRARLEATRSARVADVLSSVLSGVDPYATEQHEPTVRGLLEAGASHVRHDLAEEPDLRAEMLTVIGRTQQRLGLLDAARVTLDEAIQAGRRHQPAGSLPLAFALTEYGVLLRERGDTPASVPVLEEALAMRRRVNAEPKDVAVTLVELGRSLEETGALDRAEALYREGLAIRRAVFGEMHRETSTAMTDLGLLLRLRGDILTAESLLLQALTTSRAVLGDDHPNVGVAWNNVGLTLLDKGDPAAAEPALRRALAIRETQFGSDHASLGISLGNLAGCLRELGAYDEAAGLLERGITLARAGYGDAHPILAHLLYDRGVLYLAQGDATSAERVLRDTLVRQGRLLRPDDWRLAVTRSALGGALHALGRHAEAEPLLANAVSVLRDVPGREGREAGLARQRLDALHAAMSPSPTRSR